MTSKNSGIYKITNTVTGKFYIGSAVNIRKRINEHRSELRANTHVNRHLQNAWNKHGADCFEFTALEYCKKERLIEREQFYIDSENPSYNICQTAGSTLGIKLTEQTKRKLSEARKGRTAPNKGVPMSEEQKRKLSEAFKGENNPNFGKHLTEERKRKMSEAMTRWWAERKLVHTTPPTTTLTIDRKATR